MPSPRNVNVGKKQREIHTGKRSKQRECTCRWGLCLRWPSLEAHLKNIDTNSKMSNISFNPKFCSNFSFCDIKNAKQIYCQNSFVVSNTNMTLDAPARLSMNSHPKKLTPLWWKNSMLTVFLLQTQLICQMRSMNIFPQLARNVPMRFRQQQTAPIFFDYLRITDTKFHFTPTNANKELKLLNKLNQKQLVRIRYRRD